MIGILPVFYTTSVPRIQVMNSWINLIDHGVNFGNIVFDGRFVEDTNLKPSKHAEISLRVFLPIDLMDWHLFCSLNFSNRLWDKSSVQDK